MAALHLPGGPVGPASRWAGTSNVEVGQTTYPVNMVSQSAPEDRRLYISTESEAVGYTEE